MADDLLARTKRWIDDDPDPDTRAELEALMAAGDIDELRDRMSGSLEFGTAGIRGKVEAGSNRMNRATVIRTTAGLAAYLTRDGLPDRPVVVGRDARLSSAAFMDDTVSVLAAAGLDVRFFPDPIPTPVVAFATRSLKAVAGVVITASHNPPADNGYKVYGPDAVQIVPPVDRDIAEAIAGIGAAVDVPCRGGKEPQAVSNEVIGRYLKRIMRRRGFAADPTMRIVYTPLHGVGWSVVEPAMRKAGYGALLAVPEQVVPDGRFPTVDFPNPEEPGALDLAEQLARQVAADVIIANDPDTDRLAVSVRRRDGAWAALTGNQLGVMLGDFVLRHTERPRPLVVNSIVSTPMLGAVAAHHAVLHAETLTGFKWIWTAALDLEASEDVRFVFGFEEALGYSIDRTVRDKDGISAAVTFLDLLSEARSRGRDALDVLEDLYREHGLWVSVQKSIVRPGASGATEIAQAMERASGRPSKLGGVDVVGQTDYRTGEESRQRWLPNTSLMAYHLAGGSRALVRPSGTEPKLKIYVDWRGEVSGDVWEDEADARAAARRAADDLAAFLGID